MICQLCNKPVGSHWTSHPIIGAICSECNNDELVQRTLVSKSPEMRVYIKDVVAVQWKNDGRYNG